MSPSDYRCSVSCIQWSQEQRRKVESTLSKAELPAQQQKREQDICAALLLSSLIILLLGILYFIG